MIIEQRANVSNEEQDSRDLNTKCVLLDVKQR